MRKKWVESIGFYSIDPYIPDSTTAAVIVKRLVAVLPRNEIGALRRLVDDALQLDGAADPIEFLRRRDPPVVVDCDEGNCRITCAYAPRANTIVRTLFLL